MLSYLATCKKNKQVKPEFDFDRGYLDKFAMGADGHYMINGLKNWFKYRNILV